VTTGAFHLALANWMRKGLHGLCSLLLVAIEADFGLRRYGQHRVALGMHRVAIGAGDSIVIMRAAVPGKAGVAQVALDTIGILVFYQCRRVRSESRNRRALLAAPYPARVVTTWAVACLALQLSVSKRGVWILRDGMSGTKYREDCLVVVTLEARIGAFLAVTRRRRLFLSSLRHYDPGGGDGHQGHHQHRGFPCCQFHEHQLYWNSPTP